MELIFSQTAFFTRRPYRLTPRSKLLNHLNTAITIQLIAKTIANGVKMFYSDLGNRLSLHAAMSGRVAP